MCGLRGTSMLEDTLGASRRPWPATAFSDGKLHFRNLSHWACPQKTEFYQGDKKEPFLYERLGGTFLPLARGALGRTKLPISYVPSSISDKFSYVLFKK